MQESLDIEVPEEWYRAFSAGIASAELIKEFIGQHAEKIGYMLQAYYPREKVSQVQVVSETVAVDHSGNVFLKLQYILEEYSACSAVDTLQQERMNFMITPCTDGTVLNLRGENWPQRD